MSHPHVPHAFIHGLVSIDKGVVLGHGVTVWQFATILDGTVIGDGSVVGSCCWVGRRCKIGSGARLQHGCFLPHGTILEDSVFLGPLVVLTDDRWPRAGNVGYTAEPPVIREGASIGAGAVILPGVEIGRGAMIGAGAVVTRDVADGDVVRGEPARILQPHKSAQSAREGRLIQGRPLPINEPRHA